MVGESSMRVSKPSLSNTENTVQVVALLGWGWRAGEDTDLPPGQPENIRHDTCRHDAHHSSLVQSQSKPVLFNPPTTQTSLVCSLPWLLQTSKSQGLSPPVRQKTTWSLQGCRSAHETGVPHLSVQTDEFPWVPISPGWELHVPQGCSILHAS